VTQLDDVLKVPLRNVGPTMQGKIEFTARSWALAQPLDTGVADPVGNHWKRPGRRPGDAGRSAAATPALPTVNQPDHGVSAVEDLSAVGELSAGLLQFPPEAVQQGAASGTAAYDQLQVGSRVVGNSLALR
jgi:hypothetical protein